ILIRLEIDATDNVILFSHSQISLPLRYQPYFSTAMVPETRGLRCGGERMGTKIDGGR
ncbi:hypothetical protein A2U01_0098356, partial [Trifolium medium]|nr:hypothetical protein [Trifolium medium]